jgi:hypothetical protein
MIVLLPLLAKLSPDQRVLIGRTLVVLGAVFLAIGFTGRPWLVVLSAWGLLLGVASLASARWSRRRGTSASPSH